LTCSEFLDEQKKIELAYQAADYKTVQEKSLVILNKVDSIRADSKKTSPNWTFDDMNKTFVEDALNVVFHKGVDDREKEILRKLFSKKIITKEKILCHYEAVDLQGSEFSESLYNFLHEIGVLSKQEAIDYIDGEETETTKEQNKKYNKKMKEIENKILGYIKETPGFLQKNLKDLYSTFSEPWDAAVAFHQLLHEGRIERKKSGRTFELSVKAMVLSVLFFALILFHGCATTNTPGTNQHTQVSSSKSVHPNYSFDTTGNIIVKRDSGFMGSALGATLYINDEELVKLSPGEFFQFKLSSGTYFLALKSGEAANLGKPFLRTLKLEISESSHITVRVFPMPGQGMTMEEVYQ